jgi:hypothetical protein
LLLLLLLLQPHLLMLLYCSILCLQLLQQSLQNKGHCHTKQHLHIQLKFLSHTLQTQGEHYKRKYKKGKEKNKESSNIYHLPHTFFAVLYTQLNFKFTCSRYARSGIILY